MNKKKRKRGQREEDEDRCRGLDIGARPLYTAKPSALRNTKKKKMHLRLIADPIEKKRKED